MDYVAIALTLGDKILDLLPSYDEKLVKRFYEKKSLYLKEIARDYGERDDDLILYLREDLKLMLSTIAKDLDK